jgi:hypothetical protein
MNELNSLQNAADYIGVIVHEKINTDKRKKVSTYFLQDGNETKSPVLPYNELNHFIHGWIECIKTQTNKTFLTKIN